MKTLLGIIIFLTPFSLWSQAFPGAEGYGAVTRGAYSGSSEPAILIVDNLSAESFGDDATGRGSFLWAITREYPRVVMFEVSGIIDYRDRTAYITISNSYLTIAGQTSPKEGMTIFGTNLVFSGATDIIIQHIRVRVGNHPPGQGYDTRRGLSFWSCDRVMVDHTTISWAMRNAVDIHNFENASFTNLLISEPLYNAEYSSGGTLPHLRARSFLLTPRPKGTRVTVKDNLMAFTVTRNPYNQAHESVVINNCTYLSSDHVKDNIDTRGVGQWYLRGAYTEFIKSASVGNVFLITENSYDHPNPDDYWERVGRIEANVELTDEIYVADNECVLSLANPELTQAERFQVLKSGFVFQSTSPIDLSGYNIIPASEVEQHVLANAGAKPWHRDPTDERIINQVASRQGEYINSVYPRYAKVYNWWNPASVGNMLNGFNWNTNPTSITVNGTTLTLNQNCANIDAIVTYLNTMMPAGTRAYKHYGGEYVGFKTTGTGSTEQLTVSGGGLADFGIRKGAYYGEDGVADWNYDSDTRALSSIAGYPASPHESSVDPRFTNLQMWLHALTENETPVASASGNARLPDAKKSVHVFPNCAKGYVRVVVGESMGEAACFQIINMNGKIVYEDFINAGITDIQIPGTITTGAYNIKIALKGLPYHVQRLVIAR